MLLLLEDLLLDDRELEFEATLLEEERFTEVLFDWLLLVFWLMLELLLELEVLLEFDCTRVWVRLVEFRFTCVRLVLPELFRIVELLLLLDLVSLELVDPLFSLDLTSRVVVFWVLVFGVSLFTVVRVDVLLSLTVVLVEVLPVFSLTVVLVEVLPVFSLMLVFLSLVRTGIFLFEFVLSFLTILPESPLLTRVRVVVPRLSQSLLSLGIGSFPCTGYCGQ